MKQVGTRHEPEAAKHPDGSLLAEDARFNEAVAGLARTTFIPKGVYRKKPDADANRHVQECLVRGMSRLVVQRG